MLLAACFAPVRDVFAHATYVRSDPSSGGQLSTPGRIRVIFTEDLDATFSELQVVDSARRRVDNRDTAPVQGDSKSLTISVPSLGDGTYLVTWKTLSTVDGHTARGIFPLVVGAGGSTEVAEFEEARGNPLEVLFRTLVFYGTLTLTGLAAFIGLIVVPSLRGLESVRGATEVIDEWERTVRRFALVVSLLTVIGAVGWLAQQTLAVAEGSSASALALRYLTSRTGLIWMGKIALTLLIAEAFWHADRAWLATGVLALGAATLLLTSLTSHAAAFPRGAELAVAVDWLHQTAAACWMGGLAGLVLLAGKTLSAGAPEQTQLLGRIVPRFSTLAIVSVTVLVLTGLFSSAVQVGSPQALGNIYGGALIFKIIALVPMLLLGVLNLLVYRPKFIAGLAQRGRISLDHINALSGRLRLTVIVEVALGCLILLATGVLTSVEPGKDIAARQPRPLELSGTADELPTTLLIEPGRIGSNTFTAVITEADGSPARDVQRAQLRFSYLDQDLGQGTRTMQPAGDGRFVVDGSDLTVSGRWQVELVVRRRDREDATAAYRFDLGVITSDGGAAIPLPAFTTPYTPVTLALLLLGLGIGFWCIRLSGLPRHLRQGYATASMVVALTSAIVLVRSMSFAPDLRSLRNPIAPSSASLARGQELYQGSGCVECHGVAGRGDGPIGRTLNPRPADFRVHMAAGHTDGELFDWMTNGVAGTAMPAYREYLSEEERWHLINYIRRFAGGESVAGGSGP
ncbi:MAG: CopD family protein [Chloroflexota bacterium]